MQIVKTLSHAGASFALSFGAFALPVALFLSGNLSYAEPDAIETRAAAESAPLVSLPMPMSSEAASPETVSEASPPTTEGQGTESAPLAPSAIQASSRRQGARVVSSSDNGESKTKKKKKKCLADNPDIERVDAATYAVERSVIKYYGGHLRELNRLGYASMYKVQGKSTGFVVRGIQCGNDLHQAGIRNGDVIHAVNGKRVTNIPQALAAYATLKGKDELTVSITRRGAARDMIYRLG
jgi:hypothetical protein